MNIASGCTAAIETCPPRDAKKSLAKTGGIHVRPLSQPNLAIYAKLPPPEAVRRPPPHKVRGGPLVTEPSHALFLSYASQDAHAAKGLPTPYALGNTPGKESEGFDCLDQV